MTSVSYVNTRIVSCVPLHFLMSACFWISNLIRKNTYQMAATESTNDKILIRQWQ